MRYLQKAKVMCTKSQACGNIEIVMQREPPYLRDMMSQIQTIYKSPTNRRRGLINGIGSVAKSLFGTMNVKNEKLNIK